MRNRFNQIVFLIVLLGLTACSTLGPTLEVNKESSKPVVLQESESTAKPKPDRQLDLTDPGQCSAVDEKSVRSACFEHQSGERMCQPQSIPYARCRSHISTCNLGNTSPVQLFNCEQQHGYTSSIPQAGALMSIGVNRVHHMSTGHTLYVEEVCPSPDGAFKLRVSHTNFDRKCHLEEDVWVDYDPKRKSADFKTGHWAAWGKNLPVQGFILREPVRGKSED